MGTSPSRIAGIAVSTWAASKCATPLRGCPETYSPSISRSRASLCLSSHSSSGTLMVNTGSAVPVPSSLLPKRSNCPSASAFLVPSTESTASLCTRKRPLRACPSESNAPALISDSVTFLLHAEMSILFR
ncbi:Uncharacterised protein [Mycobacterium tuberculosis]|nr:Uncharacterised protein [Mycobacterium tuberculosis]